MTMKSTEGLSTTPVEADEPTVDQLLDELAATVSQPFLHAASEYVESPREADLDDRTEDLLPPEAMFGKEAV